MNLQALMYEVLRQQLRGEITLPVVIDLDESIHADGMKCGQDGCPCATDENFVARD